MTAAGADNLVFRAVGSPDFAGGTQPAGYRFELWEPSLAQPVPPGVARIPYAVWWLFDRARIFRNDAYGVVLVWQGNVLAHRLAIFPGWFRFPFMERDDLQLGDLWTSPEHRGRGLATCAIRFAMRARAREQGRVFWYVTHEANTASIGAAERAGLERFGRAARTRRWGVSQLGSFELR